MVLLYHEDLLKPHSFIKNTRFTDGSGWTNEFHIYNLSEGIYIYIYIYIRLSM